MRSRHLLILLGVVFVALGLVEQGWLFVLAWLGCDLLVLGIAHGRDAHRVFGKRPDGTLPWWSWLLFLPLHAFTWALWHLVRLAGRKPAYNVVNDQLVIGRRLRACEVNDRFDNFVDLTAEFFEPGAICHAASYRSFPILDGAAPTPEALQAVVASLRPGRTFIHCAQGHGRTGLFAAAVLLHSGTACSVEESLAILLRVRPAIRLNREQRQCLEAYAQNIKRPDAGHRTSSS